jgi:large subunit ribosomal protein L15
VLKIPHKVRKIRKQRAGRYHGWGQVGQHRKSGMRGGKGKAGGRKHFWIRTVKYEPERYEKKGFKPPSSLKIASETINVGELEALALKTLGINELSEDYELDLKVMGINKLLGRGSIRVPLKVRVEYYSNNAKEKIEEAGGSVVA